MISSKNQLVMLVFSLRTYGKCMKYSIYSHIDTAQYIYSSDRTDNVIFNNYFDQYLFTWEIG